MSPADKRKRPATPAQRAGAGKGRPAAGAGRPVGKDRPATGNGRPAVGKGPGRTAAQGPPVVGKRPSNPGLLAAIAVMWFVAAVAVVFLIHEEWKIVPVIVFAGIGFLYLRGAAGAYSRREAPPKGNAGGNAGGKSGS
ncbi:MAG: hypothetical protein ACRDJU_04280 [Actinomycetota bacterium]